MDAADLAFVSDEGTAFAVLGKREDFILVSLGGAEPLQPAITEANGNGFSFCGVVARVNGAPMAAIEPGDPMHIYTMAFAGAAYARRIAEEIKARAAQRDGTVDWCRALYALPDDRRVH